MKVSQLDKIIEKPITGEWGEDEGETKVIRTTNFTNRGEIDFEKIVTRAIPEKKIAAKKLKIGDIIIEKSGGSPTQPVGRVVYFDAEGEYLCNNFTSILRPKKHLVFPKFLHYQLFAAHRFGVTEMFQNKTTGIINLQLSRYISKLELPLPPLEEQKRIAQILDDAQALKQKTEILIQEYNSLAQSIFLDMFGDPVTNPKGWEKINLSSISNISSGSTPSRKKEENFIGNIPWVKTGEVKGGYIYETEESISDNALKTSSCKIFPKGSLLIAMYGQGKTRGQVGILGVEATTNQACAVIPPSEIINFQYLFELLIFCYDDLRQLGRGGNQPNLNIGLIKNYFIIYPPLELQNQFAEKIALIEKQKEIAQKELTETENLFNCLLQKAFKGELK